MRLATAMFALVLFVAGCSHPAPTPKPVAVTITQPLLLGPVERNALSGSPYRAWYDEQYTDYELDTLTLAIPAETLTGTDITIFMGAWCSDSRREVPRVYKILDYLEYPAERVTLLALDRDKRGPGREEEGFDIDLVPTIILYRSGVEIGRIVELPTDTLEEDIANILLQ